MPKGRGKSKKRSKKTDKGVAVKILYDNVAYYPGVQPAWGFSALISFQGKIILFDAGGKPDVLLANMRKLRISQASISDVFISHNHWDHAGGLFSFLARNHRVKVYLPSSFSKTYQKEVLACGAECVRIGSFSEITRNIYSTGPLGEAIKEQALVIETPKGLIIMTGCAHPGIVKIIRTVKNKLKKPIYAIIGGFHLAEKSRVEIDRIIAEFQRLGVVYSAPCHCTGEKAIKRFQAAYGENFISVGAGSEKNI